MPLLRALPRCEQKSEREAEKDSGFETCPREVDMKKLSRKEETACENATYEIDVRKGFQLAGFYFSVEAEHSNCKGLARNNNLGTCDSGTKEIKIEPG